MMKRKQLLLGGGQSREKRMAIEESPEKDFESLTVLDMQRPCNVVFDLRRLYGYTPCGQIDTQNLPFEDNEFDEIHAYEVLEHIGSQGDFEGFFYEFGEYWRILKPDGLMFITCPMWDSPWAYADPGHTRVLPKEIFSFLSHEHYEQVGKPGSACSDYRQWLGDTNFVGHAFQETQHNLFVVLRAKKK